MIWPAVLWTGLGVATAFMLLPSTFKAYHTWHFWKHYPGNGKRAARVTEARADFRRQVWRAIACVGVIGSGVLGTLEQLGFVEGIGLLTFSLLVLIPIQLFVNVTLDWYADKSVVSKLPRDETVTEVLKANTIALDANTAAVETNTEKLAEGEPPTS